MDKGLDGLKTGWISFTRPAGGPKADNPMRGHMAHIRVGFKAGISTTILPVFTAC
jgi:hypothetical protein